MNNSAISRSSRNKANVKLSGQSLHESLMKRTELDNRASQQNSKVKGKQYQTPPNLFRPFAQPLPNDRMSQNQIQNQNLSKKSSLTNISQPITQTPVFYRSKRQQQYREPRSSFQTTLINSLNQEKERQKSKYADLQLELGKFNRNENKGQTGQFLDFQHDLSIHSRKSIESDDFAKVQNIEFGEGLQRIHSPQKKQLFGVLPKDDKNRLTSSSLHSKQPSQILSSTFSPQPSGYSLTKKMINKRITEVERQSGRNFFKKPLGSSHSHDYLKTFYAGDNTKSSDKKPFRKQRHDVDRDSGQKVRSVHFGGDVEKHDETRSGMRYLKSMNDIARNNYNRQSCHLSLANNLTRILFKYTGGHATTLYNYRLKLKNQSPFKLQITIRSTSPRHFTVHPQSPQLLPNQIANISIQLKLYQHDLDFTTMRHDLTRYKNDKFKISYEAIEDFLHEEECRGEKILPVVIQETEEERLRNQKFVATMSKEQTRLENQEKQIQVYKKMVEKNKIMEEEIQMKIALLQKHQFYLKYFSKGLFLTVAFLGFLIGLCLA